MKRTLYLSTIILLSLASCKGKDIPDDGPGSIVEDGTAVTVSATVSDGLPFVWSAGDKVSFLTADLKLCPPFKAESGGTADTSLKGTKPEGTELKYALYPYDPSVSYSKSGIETSLSGKQDGTAKSLLLVSEGSEEDGFTFNSICCLLKLEVPESLDIVKIEAFSDEGISGRVSAYDAGNGLVIHSDGPSSIADQRAAAVNASGLTGTVYISILPTQTSGLSLSFTDSKGKTAILPEVFAAGRTFAAGSIEDLGTVSDNLVFTEAAPLSDPTNQQL